MKKKGKAIGHSIMNSLLIVGMLTVMTGCRPDAEIMQKTDGEFIVNTTKLTPNVLGFEDTTPLKIHIADNKITKIEVLPNRETPRYLARIKTQLLPRWYGMEVKHALKNDVDGVTGATYTAKSIKENVRKGLEYYQKYK